MPIPGALGPRRIEENTAAGDMILTETGLTAINTILPHGGSGYRYHEKAMPTWT
ncbi:hypothetical protein ACFWFI_36955 [Streptomyces sp. NPDC060209]|uniref:hypothetical protein n=1 Tax=Streptomyces sp. NPDC060209 TaxID=3347073 RepID=UPI003669CB84